MPKSRGRPEGTVMRHRPTKISAEIQQEIVDIVRTGNYLETAAAHAGISVSTVRDWIRRGERERQRLEKNPNNRMLKKEEPYFDFSAAVKKAQAESEMLDVMTIGLAAQENWQAAAWRLERKHYERWGRKDRHEHTGKDGGAIEVDYKRTLMEQIDRVLGGDDTDE